jgi:hypothetical protein
VLECALRTIHPFYNGSTALPGELADDALHARSIEPMVGAAGAVEQ